MNVANDFKTFLDDEGENPPSYVYNLTKTRKNGAV